MRSLQSKSNPFFKRLLRVAQQRDSNFVLLEGLHLCQVYWERYGAPEAVLWREGSSLPKASWQRSLLDLPQVYCLPASLFDRLCSTPSPQPLNALVSVPRPTLQAPVANCLYLDRIQDPGNMGTLLRTAVAVGIKHVYCSVACVSPWSPKVLRSAQGAHFALQLYTQVDSQWFLQHNRLPVWVTQLNDRSCHLYEIDIPRDVVWVLGNEGQGVSTIFCEQAQQSVFIPQHSSVESLNVGVAGSVALYEQARQHGFVALR